MKQLVVLQILFLIFTSCEKTFTKTDSSVIIKDDTLIVNEDTLNTTYLIINEAVDSIGYYRIINSYKWVDINGDGINDFKLNGSYSTWSQGNSAYDNTIVVLNDKIKILSKNICFAIIYRDTFFNSCNGKAVLNYSEYEIADCNPNDTTSFSSYTYRIYPKVFQFGDTIKTTDYTSFGTLPLDHFYTIYSAIEDCESLRDTIEFCRYSHGGYYFNSMNDGYIGFMIDSSDVKMIGWLKFVYGSELMDFKIHSSYYRK
jgi:hypothetical protein